VLWRCSAAPFPKPHWYAALVASLCISCSLSTITVSITFNGHQLLINTITITTLNMTNASIIITIIINLVGEVVARLILYRYLDGMNCRCTGVDGKVVERLSMHSG
jgi:hypothetical protein